MDEIAAIRALAHAGERPGAEARRAARQSLQAKIELSSTSSSAHRIQARRRGLLGLVAAGALASAVALLSLVGTASHSPQPAYGAQLVRFAQSTPRLLIERPGWVVRNMFQRPGGEGKIEFGPELADSAEAHISSRNLKPGGPEPGWRSVELTWAPLNGAAKRSLAAPRNHGFTATLPVLGTRAYVDPGVLSPLRGSRGYRYMDALWQEGSRAIYVSVWAKDLGAFREVLLGLRRVDAETWLEAMPARVVKAAEYGTEIDAMLKGVPLPRGFQPSSIPNLHLTTSRYSVGKAVGGAVACEWFDRWFQADASQDHADSQKARQVLLNSSNWPVFERIAKEGPYPALVIGFARALPSGRFGHNRPLFGIVNKSCAEIGFSIVLSAKSG